MGHFVQADIDLPDRQARFWMDSCGGRDQVAMAVLGAGWAGYEAPLPALIAEWCARRAPVVVDVGANTGFYGLLSAACGARRVHAFEPVAEIMDILRANVATSELSHAIELHATALGDGDGAAPLYFPPSDHGLVETSASLQRTFRARHSAERSVPLARLDRALPPDASAPAILRIDVEGHEAAVLRGATGWLETVRPAVVCELLTEADLAAVGGVLGGAGYRRMTPTVGAAHRDRVFLPEEAGEIWRSPLLAPG